MAIGAINEKLGTKLLCASQVAITSRKAEHQMNRDQAKRETNRAPRSSFAWVGTDSANPANSADARIPLPFPTN